MNGYFEQEWIEVKLDELGKLHCGQSPSVAEVNQDGIGEVYVTGPEQYQDGKIIAEKWTTNPKRIAPDHSIFITVKGSVGEIFEGCHAAIGRDIYAFEPSKLVSLEYVFWAIKEGVGEIILNAKGDIPGISKPHILEHRIKFPNRKTQDAVVEKIEQLFDLLDRGEESLRAARDKAGLYRQSLLKHAFEGHLTADWRAANPDKLEAPETLLTRIQKERDARYKHAIDEWQDALAKWRAEGEEGKKPKKPKRPADLDELSPRQDGFGPYAAIRLGLVIEEPTYGTSKKCGYETGGTGVLRIPNIANGQIDDTDLKSADFEEDELNAYALREGDLLTIRSNGSVSLVGTCAAIKSQHEQHLFAGYLIRLRPFQTCVTTSYLLFTMRSQALRQQIEFKAKSTSGVNNINSKELQNLIVSICSPAEQAEIVNRLEAKLSTLDALEVDIDRQLARSRALRQSILKRAFEGKLVPQDPTDEPASTLLERIQAEREAAPKPKRKRKTPA